MRSISQIPLDLSRHVTTPHAIFWAQEKVATCCFLRVGQHRTTRTWRDGPSGILAYHVTCTYGSLLDSELSIDYATCIGVRTCVRD